MYHNNSIVFNDEYLGSITYTDLKLITEERKKFGSDCYTLRLYFHDTLIFSSAYNKEIKIEDNRIYIYSF